MSSLQQLHDAYIKTRPTGRKVQTTSQLLIRLCRKMDLDGPQDITPEYYGQLPGVIDRYCQGNIHKAIQDKSTLAEMIGRHGPIDGWEKTLDVLLTEPDSNLRQFVLQSLEYIAVRKPEIIIPYIEKYLNGEDPLLSNVGARVISRSLTADSQSYIEMQLSEWEEKKQFNFLALIKKHMAVYIRRADDFAKDPFYKIIYDRLTKVLLENN